MSDFPERDSYQTKTAQAHFRYLSRFGAPSDIPLIIKKEKNAYLYDCDGNKYVDFYLNNGTVILGHTQSHHTQMVKNGISSGLTDALPNKFTYRLFRLIEEFSDGRSISLYRNTERALVRILQNTKSQSIAVNSSFLHTKLTSLSVNLSVEMAQRDKIYDILIFEPIDFDNDLSLWDDATYQARVRVAYEERTAFRLQYGFLRASGVDYSVGGRNIASGMEAGLVLSRETIDSDTIPIYQTLSIIETLKALRRKSPLNFPKLDSRYMVHQNGSIFKVKKPLLTQELLPYGIFMRGSLGFLCMHHTEFDCRRLYRALVP